MLRQQIFFLQPSTVLLAPCSYYNAWMETYTEEEYKQHSGTHLEEDEESDGSETPSESELDSDMEQGGSSIEFQNETFSDGSFGSDEESDSSDSFHSVQALSPQGGRGLSNGVVGGTGGRGYHQWDEDEAEDVFMDNFSDNSEGSARGRNMLGKLETQVMNMSISKFRR